MPVVYEKRFEGGVLALWRLEESSDALAELCTAAEQRYAENRFATESRKREWFGWHALLHALDAHATAAYDDQGAPVLHSKQYRYIGVSHTNDFVAVVLGEQPCAVDIENRNRDFHRAAAKFVSPAEVALKESLAEEFLPLVWCAKECVYKLIRRQGVNLLTDLVVTQADLQTGRVVCRAFDQQIVLKHSRFEDLCVVYGS